MSTNTLRESLTSGLFVQPPGYYGLGSAEISAPTQGEGGIRRLAISSHRLTERPHPCVSTVADVMTYASRTYGSKYNAVGWRETIKIHEEVREVVNTIDGQEVKQKKTWKLYELSDYKYLTFAEFAKVVGEVRDGLLQLGIKKEDVVNVYSQTGPSWQFMSHACASISTSIATAYDTLGIEGLTHSLNEPDCIAVFTNADLLPTLAQVIFYTRKLKYILYDGKADPSILSKMQGTRDDIRFMHLDDLRTLGRSAANDSSTAEQLAVQLEERKPTPDTIACIMYTSGSTGPPKGVCLTHGNLVASVSSVTMLFGPNLPAGDIYLAYLPLAHVLEYIVELCAFFSGVCCGYAKPKTLTDAGVIPGCRGDLIALRPHIMFGVPSVWETIRKGIIGKLNDGGALKKALFYSAMEAKKRGTPFFSGLAERVVLSKVREATGGRLKYAMNGGAAISRDTQEFLSLAIMPMLQGYGLTETCGMCTLLTPEYMQFGVVGIPVPSVEIKLLDVPNLGYLSTNRYPQGEVCIRGPSVFKGYYKRPDLNSDESIWTKDGWFRTGDVGVWNDDGTLSLIDRIKNLVKMPNGEFIALEKLESVYKSCDLVSNLCVHAAPGAAHPVAVLFPHENNLRHALSLSQDSQAALIRHADLPTLCNSLFVQELILKACNEIGKKTGLKGPEILGGVVLCPEEWTPETGLVSAAMKVRRASVASIFEKEIESVYSSRR